LRRGLHSCAASRLIDYPKWDEVIAVMMVTAFLVGYFPTLRDIRLNRMLIFA